MKRFRKTLGIVALALMVSLSLAMPVSAWADEAESYAKPEVFRSSERMVQRSVPSLQVYGQGLRKR